MLVHSLYIATKDEKNHTHNYRLPITETVPEGHEVTAVKIAGQFKLSSLLSKESIGNLLTVR